MKLKAKSIEPSELIELGDKICKLDSALWKLYEQYSTKILTKEQAKQKAQEILDKFVNDIAEVTKN